MSHRYGRQLTLSHRPKQMWITCEAWLSWVKCENHVYQISHLVSPVSIIQQHHVSPSIQFMSHRWKQWFCIHQLPNNHVSPLLTANYLSHRPKPLWVWLWRVEFPCLTGVYRVAPAETVRYGVLVYVSPVWASTNPVWPTETNVNYLWDTAQLGEMWKPCIPNISPCLTGVHHPTTSCLSVIQFMSHRWKQWFCIHQLPK